MHLVSLLLRTAVVHAQRALTRGPDGIGERRVRRRETDECERLRVKSASCFSDGLLLLGGANASVD